MASAYEPAIDVLVPLRDGPVVPASLISWLIDAEFRGLAFRIEPDGRLHVGPREKVTAADLAFVRGHRDLVLACVAYSDTVEVM
jgi:hypothetical protein